MASMYSPTLYGHCKCGSVLVYYTLINVPDGYPENKYDLCMYHALKHPERFSVNKTEDGEVNDLLKCNCCGREYTAYKFRIEVDDCEDWS